MKTRLSLQEKLRDLRDERKRTLAQVAEETGIPAPTLQRIESSEDIRVGYQDMASLANFYEVSTDYLFGLTDNRQRRHVEIDSLRLSDSAIALLKDGKLNNRLISEFLSHPDFPDLSRAMEVYIDRKIQPQINSMNAMYKFAEKTLKEEVGDKLDDEILAFLNQAQIDEDEYLRYRISERFNQVMKGMFEAHKKDNFAETSGAMEEYKEVIDVYKAVKDNPNYTTERKKLYVLGKQLGLNINKLEDEEVHVLIKALGKSEKAKQGKKRKK